MRTSTLVACLLAFAAQPAPAEDPKGDLALLQGTWTCKIGPDRSLDATLTLKGTAAEMVINRPGDDDFKIKGELKLDEKASPKTIDWVKFVMSSGDDLPDSKAIYKFEGDSWIVCSGGPGGDRPAAFKDSEDGPPMLSTWTRVKPKDAPKEKAVEKDPKSPK